MNTKTVLDVLTEKLAAKLMREWSEWVAESEHAGQIEQDERAAFGVMAELVMDGVRGFLARSYDAGWRHATSEAVQVCESRASMHVVPDLWEPPNPSPLAAFLSYSGGVQSHAIARMILRKEIEIPERFMLIAADPGNEHAKTIEIRDRTIEEFRQAGIPAMIAPGPKMLDEIKAAKAEGKGRIDNAALWTLPDGQLTQGCTRHYKIRPMRRVMLAYVKRVFGLRSIGKHQIENWIGFAYDETSRIKPLEDGKLMRFQGRYPLVDRKLTKEAVLDWYERTGEELPPRSVCNHCWANSVKTLKRIHDTDPKGWRDAVEFDELSRDMSQFGVRNPCYVSKTCVPLVQLQENGFDGSGIDADAYSCDSGHCFI